MSTENEKSPEFHASALFAPSPDDRVRATRHAPRTAANAAHLRAVLLFDRAVGARVAAAEALTRFLDPSVGPHLRDGLRDPSPLVRDAVARGLARVGDVAALAQLAAIAREDDVWFVRRTAAFAYAALAGFAAAPLMLEVLEDPFWRVRHAAVLALEALGHASDEVRERVLSERMDTPAAERARKYLRARWELEVPSLAIARDHEQLENDPWYDDDPAVITARVAERLPPPERLVAMLGESHEPLRKLAIAGLANSGDRIALAGAACWLDAPRVPHAAESARKALSLAGDDGVAVAIAAVSSRLPGVASWAIRTAVDHHRGELAEQIVARVADPDPRVRSAVAYAAPSMTRTADDAVTLLRPLAADRDETVRAAAIAALTLVDSPSAARALADVSIREQLVSARVALVRAAMERDDVALVRAALEDPHAYVRGTAVDALRACGLLRDDERVAYTRDGDPWIRAAAVEAEDAPRVLATDGDVTVRRVVMDRVCATRRVHEPEWLREVALVAAGDGDPWVRARGARLLDARDGAPSLTALLRCESDGAAMVRAVASDALERVADIAQRVRALLDEGTVEPRSLGVALGWVARADATPGATLAQLASRPELQSMVATVALTLGDTERAKVELVSGPALAAPEAPRERRAYAPFPTESHRPFGRTGLSLAPVAFSGASEPSESVFITGRERGMNAYFWEPRYHSLTRFVRKSPKKHELAVIAGSYHADAASISRDVERALRVLKLERLGVFLLFWARSGARLDERAFDALDRLKREGKIAAHGFSTHLRDVGAKALAERPWDVVMSRFNAAHTSAEKVLWPAVSRAGAAGIAFTALCYTRLLNPVRGANTTPPSAADCYRFALSDPAVGLVLAAPGLIADATAALEAMERPTLDANTMASVRAHGAAVYREDSEFNALVRKGDRVVLADPREAALSLLDSVRAE